MSKIVPISLIFLVFYSCQTPEKALKDGYYKMAMQLAANDIRKGKNIEANKKILLISTEEFINKEFNEAQMDLNSEDVKKWKRVQNQLYLNLEIIGKANINSGFLITGHYNDFCSYKKDLDFKIVDYFYQNGIKEMLFYDKTGMKENARKAYYFFEDSGKNGGHIFYNDIDILMNEALEKGMVYYTLSGDYDIGSSLFLKELPYNSDLIPDCEVSVNEGYVSISESENETVTNFEKEVEIGTRTEKDTSGNVINIPIYETKTAKLIKKTVKITASQTVHVNIKNHSGQCNISSHSFSESVEECYDEIKAEGYKEAITESYIEGSNEPILLESTLEDKVRDKIKSSISFWY